MAEPTTITQTLPSPQLAGITTAFTEALAPLIKPGQIDPSKFQGRPFVAGLGSLTQQALGQASGLGSYQPYLQTAGALAPQTAQQFQQLTQDFMSPYQQQVIQATEAGLQRQKQKALAGMSAGAVGQGAFGGAREGIQSAEYSAAQDVQAQQLLSQLRQQGFQQAQASAQQALQNQLGLAGLAPQLAQQEITGLTQLGGIQQQQEQALLTADQQLAQQQQYAPFTQLGLVGQQLAQLTPGALPSQVQTLAAPSAPASPIATGLGVASGIAGIGSKLGIFG
jgi:hypothetical protein